MATEVAARQKPLIAIIGATGTGKSNLAVELATKFNGEIINGDAMQMYEGLPIITNKMSLQERKGIPHHLLGGIGLGKPAWTVGQFLTAALQTIKEIRSRGRLPILVGGTHYYTQALLFKDHIIESPKIFTAAADHPILQEETDVILAKLREVDPIMADRWHPNDRRKIQRALEIWLNTGKPASETYIERLGADLNDSEGSMLRFKTLILWVHASKDVLQARLDNRVLDMIRAGLLDEVQDLYDFKHTETAAGNLVDGTRGIWVSIGYKEFEPYQNAMKFTNPSETELSSIKDVAIEQTQAATRQYSKRQIRWIRIKLLNALARAKALHAMFLLDGSNILQWQDRVSEPSVKLLESFLSGDELPNPVSLSTSAAEMLQPKSEDLTQRPDLWVKRTCDACGVTAVTPSAWNTHIKSRRHRKVVAGMALRNKPGFAEKDRRFEVNSDRHSVDELPSSSSEDPTSVS